MNNHANRKGTKQVKAGPKAGKGSGPRGRKTIKIEEKVVQLGAIRIEIQINGFSVKWLG